jgi:hypothetical protein
MSVSETLTALKSALDARVAGLRKRPVTAQVVSRMQRAADVASVTLRQTDQFRDVTFRAIVDSAGEIQVTVQE